jgi:hypothetical protein
MLAPRPPRTNGSMQTDAIANRSPTSANGERVRSAILATTKLPLQMPISIVRTRWGV